VLFFVEGDESNDVDSTWTKPYGAVHSIFLGYVGFLQAGPAHSPRTMAGRVIVIGYAFLVLVSVASYTANLAAALTASNSQVGFSTIEAIAAAGKPVCVNAEWMQQIVQTHYGAPTILLNESSEHELGYGVLGLLTPGTTNTSQFVGKRCSGAVVDVDQFEYELTPDMCSLQLVGKPLFNLPVGFPSTPDVAPTLSYYITKLRENGTIKGLMPPNPQVCSAATTSSARLTVEEMSGTFAVFGAAMLLGVLLCLVSYGLKLLVRQQKNKGMPDHVSRMLLGSKVLPNADVGGEDSGMKVMLGEMAASIRQLSSEVRSLKSAKDGAPLQITTLSGDV